MQIQVSEKKESLMKNLSLETKDTLPLTTEIFRFNTRFKGFNMNILYTIIIYVHFTYSVHGRIWQNTDTLKGGRTRDCICVKEPFMNEKTKRHLPLVHRY